MSRINIYFFFSFRYKSYFTLRKKSFTHKQTEFIILYLKLCFYFETQYFVNQNKIDFYAIKLLIITFLLHSFMLLSKVISGIKVRIKHTYLLFFLWTKFNLKLYCINWAFLTSYIEKYVFKEYEIYTLFGQLSYM